MTNLIEETRYTFLEKAVSLSDAGTEKLSSLAVVS